MDDSDSDDSDDDTYSRRKPEPASPTSKHAALAAATSSPSRPTKTPSPSPQSKHQPHIAAPQPGYAAPIAALNLARPDPVAVPQGRTPPTLQTQGIQNPFESPFETPSSSPTSLHGHRSPAPPYHTSTSPSPSMVSSEPHPLQPPITPITPVFARPAKTGGIKFTEADSASTPIMRGDKEETLLPSRGQRGDDFWRRFSMVVKEENKKPSTQKESSWLKKTRGGTMRLSRWVWIIGVILLLCIGAAIGIGWYASHKSPDHQQPTAFGGSANEAAVTTSSAGIKPSVLPNGATSSIKHVSPTHTVARRAAPQGTISAVHKRRLH